MWVALAVLCVVYMGWRGRRRDYRTVASAESQLVLAGIATGVPADRVYDALESLGAESLDVDSRGVLSARLGRSFDHGHHFIPPYGELFAEFLFDSTGCVTSWRVHEEITLPEPDRS
jgi:hypothetical protein